MTDREILDRIENILYTEYLDKATDVFIDTLIEEENISYEKAEQMVMEALQNDKN